MPVDPISLALMGGSMVSSIIGGQESAAATREANNIALLNYYEQVNANQRARREAARQQAEGKLGQTDAAGNRTYFVPGFGWVTDLSDDQQALLDLSEDAQKRQLTEGEARDERVQQRSNARRNEEDSKATEADREFRQARRENVGDLEKLYLARGATARNAAADRAGDRSARQSIRAGGTNAAEIRQGARAEADADSARQAAIEARLLGRQVADERFAGERQDANSLYDYFRRASTSGTGPSGTVSPTGPARISTGAADQGAINAAGRGAQMDYMAPDFSTSGTLNNIVQAGMGFYDRHTADQYMSSMLNAFGKRNLGNTGAA